MQTLIYQDYIHNNGTLYAALVREYGRAAVGFCDAADIIGGCLGETVTLFVMPGGADLFYAEKLNGPGSAAIRAWVEGGGVYLGLCAGAYYACAGIDWAKGTDQEISGARELAFFPGMAVGPVAAFIEGGDVGKSWQAAPEILWDDGEKKTTCRVFYEAGPVFAPEKDCVVLARYAGLPGMPAAIIECRAGAGKAVLCSPHPESAGCDLRRRLYRHRNPSLAWNAGIAHELETCETQGRTLWRLLLKRCGEKA